MKFSIWIIEMRRDLTGLKFGKLTVQKFAERTDRGKSKWLCICECGNKCVVTCDNLQSGNTKSCGANKHRKGGPQRGIIKHGLSRTPEYHCWKAIIDRCTNPKNRAWRHYGGRGILICDRWKELSNFVRDMG